MEGSDTAVLLPHSVRRTLSGALWPCLGPGGESQRAPAGSPKWGAWGRASQVPREVPPLGRLKHLSGCWGESSWLLLAPFRYMTSKQFLLFCDCLFTLLIVSFDAHI